MSVVRRDARVMGCVARVVVVGDGTLAAAAGRAVARLHRLEALWSRFRDGSETSLLTRRAGEACRVSPETVLLVGLAVEARRRTGGLFDPTVLSAVRAAGYVDDLALLPPDADPAALPAVPSPRRADEADVVVDPDAGTLALAPGLGLDPGGIGKGLAADLVVDQLLGEPGVAGACVDVGGDLRVRGAAPDGSAWRVGLPGGRALGVTDAGVATSSRLRQAWRVGGAPSHHLVDPELGRPAGEGVAAVTVVAAAAWEAEVLATAACVVGARGRGGPAAARRLLDEQGVEGLVVADDGAVLTTPGLSSAVPGPPSAVPVP